MSDTEEDSKDKSKRPLEVSSEGNDEIEEKRSSRKRARVDYNEDKKALAAKEAAQKEEAGDNDDDSDEIQDVTPATIKAKAEETPEPPPRSAASRAADDLMGLPMEPNGLEEQPFKVGHLSIK